MKPKSNKRQGAEGCASPGYEEKIKAPPFVFFESPFDPCTYKSSRRNAQSGKGCVWVMLLLSKRETSG